MDVAHQPEQAVSLAEAEPHPQHRTDGPHLNPPSKPGAPGPVRRGGTGLEHPVIVRRQTGGVRLSRRVDADEQDVVALDLDGLLVGEGDGLAGPEVFAGLRAVEA